MKANTPSCFYFNMYSTVIIPTRSIPKCTIINTMIILYLTILIIIIVQINITRSTYKFFSFINRISVLFL